MKIRMGFRSPRIECFPAPTIVSVVALSGLGAVLGPAAAVLAALLLDVGQFDDLWVHFFFEAVGSVDCIMI